MKDNVLILDFKTKETFIRCISKKYQLIVTLKIQL